MDNHAPITLGSSEPEPDVAVIRGDTRDYVLRHPGPENVGLVVEIPHPTIDRDRLLKKLYAVAGIVCYWLLDLNQLRLEVYSEPAEGTYRRCTIYRPGDSVDIAPITPPQAVCS